MSPDAPDGTRREWLAQLARLGLSSPLWSMILGGSSSCGGDIGRRYWDFEVAFEGKVLVIGAGASGLAAGYLLDRYGVEFEILEASSVYGGRVRRGPALFDFEFDLGAEWIHEDPRVLAALIDDPAVEGTIDVVPYSPDTLYTWSGGELSRLNVGSEFYSEHKFRTTSWYGFLERYIAPAVEGRIRFDTPAVEIDTSGAGVRVRDASGAEHTGDRALVTVPLKILQSDSIAFVPPLPANKRAAIDSVTMPDGIKVFIEFSERFYPDLVIIGDDSDRLYYDAAFRKLTSHHVLALFCVGDMAKAYTTIESDEALIAFMLEELDAMFGGRASATYLRHAAQNWSNEPYIGGSYSTTFSIDHGQTVAALAAPVDDTLFFSGEATSEDNGSTVPGAMESAYAAVEEILRRA